MRLILWCLAVMFFGSAYAQQHFDMVVSGGSSATYDYSRSIVVDNYDNLNICGVGYTPPLVFGNDSLESGGFVVRYDTSGNVLKSLNEGEHLYDIDFDSKNNMYVLSDSTNTSFVSAFDTSWNRVWGKTLVSSAWSLRDIEVSNNDLIFIAGWHNDSGFSAYLSCLDTLGRIIWENKHISGMSICNSLAVDNADNVYVHLSDYNNDTHIKKFNKNGIELWSRKINSWTGYTYNHLDIDNQGNLYVYFAEYEDFVIDSVTYVKKQNSNLYYSVLVKFDTTGKYINHITLEGLTGDNRIYDISFNDNKITATGRAQGVSYFGNARIDPPTHSFQITAFLATLDTDLNLINLTFPDSINSEGYSSCYLNGRAYYTGLINEVVSRTLLNFGGFQVFADYGDVFLAQDIQQSCLNRKYDRYDTLDCNKTIQLRNLILDEPGVYQDTFTSSLNCDSMVILKIAPSKVSIKLSFQDDTIFTTLNHLNYSGKINYNWLKHNSGNNYSSLNHYLDYYVPNSNGRYCVVTSDSNCIDTTCIDIFTIGIIESIESEFKIIPNPTNGSFQITLDNKSTGVLEVFSSLGTMVYKKNILHKAYEEVNLSPQLQEGIYFVRYTTREGIYSQKLVLKR